MIKTKQNSRFYKFHPVIEFILVLGIALGYFILSSTQWAATESAGPTVITYDDYDVIRIIIYEACVLIVIALLLKWQEWSLKDFGFSFSIEQITTGLVLFVANYLLYLLLFKMFGGLISGGEEAQAGSDSSVVFSVHISLLPLILFASLNPIFEEFILVSYISESIRHKFGLWLCLILSVGFRLSFHIYQGPIILLSILPMGIIFTIYFWYKRQILPLIIGHSLMDFLSLFVIMTIHNN